MSHFEAKLRGRSPYRFTSLTIAILIRRIQKTEANAFYEIKNQKSEKRKKTDWREPTKENQEKPKNIFNRALFNFHITTHLQISYRLPPGGLVSVANGP